MTFVNIIFLGIWEIFFCIIIRPRSGVVRFAAPGAETVKCARPREGAAPPVFGAKRTGSETKTLCSGISFYTIHNFVGVPPKKTYNFLPNGCWIVCSKSFFGRDSELQMYRGNFLLMSNIYRKLFVIKQSKGCICARNVPMYGWRSGSAPTRWESLCAAQTPLGNGGGVTSKGREEMGLTFKREGREESGIKGSSKIKVSRPWNRTLNGMTSA